MQTKPPPRHTAQGVVVVGIGRWNAIVLQDGRSVWENGFSGYLAVPRSLQTHRTPLQNSECVPDVKILARCTPSSAVRP